METFPTLPKLDFGKYFSSAPSELRYANKSFSDFYASNLGSWVENANLFRFENPEKTSKFWADIIRSDFTLKVMTEIPTLSEKNIDKWSAYEKLNFICTFYEAVYPSFAFLTFSMNYSEEYVETLCEDWFVPLKSQEFNRRRQNSWKINGNFVSGKNWIIENCKLFNFFEGDILYLKRIRNAASHNHTTILNEHILLLDEENSENITSIVDSLVKFLYDCTVITYDFHFRLLALNQFWLLPAIIHSIPEKFDYQRKTVLFGLFDSLKKEKEKKKINSDNLEGVFDVLGMILTYSLNHFWEDIWSKRDLMNRLLEPKGLSVKENKIRNAQMKTLVDFMNFMLGLKTNLMKSIANLDIVFPKITLENMGEVDVTKELQELGEFLLKTISNENKVEGVGTSILASIMLSLILSVISAYVNFIKDFTSIFMEEEEF